MRRIAHRKRRGHGKRVHLGRHGGQRGAQSVYVQRHAGLAIVVMAAVNHCNRNTRKRLGNAGALDHGGIKTDEHHAHGAAMAFDHRVGGQRGGHRDQRNVLGRQALGQFGNGVSNGARDTNGQIALGGDRLGRCHDLVALGFNDGGVGVGAAGVYADKVRRGSEYGGRSVHEETAAAPL